MRWERNVQRSLPECYLEANNRIGSPRLAFLCSASVKFSRNPEWPKALFAVSVTPTSSLCCDSFTLSTITRKIQVSKALKVQFVLVVLELWKCHGKWLIISKVIIQCYVEMRSPFSCVTQEGIRLRRGCFSLGKREQWNYDNGTGLM